jgi:hypothetical protein
MLPVTSASVPSKRCSISSHRRVKSTPRKWTISGPTRTEPNYPPNAEKDAASHPPALTNPGLPEAPSPRPATAPFRVSDLLDSSEHADNERREEGAPSAHLPDTTKEQARYRNSPLEDDIRNGIKDCLHQRCFLGQAAFTPVEELVTTVWP